jgi:hypothetical protein
MFVAGWTPGGAPYGIFEDEMDAGMNELNKGECDQPHRLTRVVNAADADVHRAEARTDLTE